MWKQYQPLYPGCPSSCVGTTVGSISIDVHYAWITSCIYTLSPYSSFTPPSLIVKLFKLHLIEVDIGGHPPIPLARKTIFHLGSFLAFFRVPNFQGYFEALKDVFWGFGAQVGAFSSAYMFTKGTNLG
jgi:hypothetical protein